MVIQTPKKAILFWPEKAKHDTHQLKKQKRAIRRQFIAGIYK